MLKGGSYEVGPDGVRRLVEGTDQTPDAPAPAPEEKTEAEQPARRSRVRDEVKE